jgi:predicted DNA-binding protein
MLVYAFVDDTDHKPLGTENKVKTTTVRVAAETQEKLRVLAEQRGESMQHVLADAVESYRRLRMIEETNTRYAALRQDPDAWAEVQSERTAWDVTLADDLMDE